MAGHIRTTLVLHTLDLAVGQRRLDVVLHRSDKGNQYTPVVFGLGCPAAKLRPSTETMGDTCGNAICESIFTTLERVS